MINQDRIVPVTKTDLLSLYGLMGRIFSSDTMKAVNAVEPGVFVAPGADADASGYLFFLTEPVRSCDIVLPAGMSEAELWFVPAYDYVGFTAGGELVTPREASDPVEADGCSLYVALLFGTDVTFIKKGF